MVNCLLIRDGAWDLKENERLSWMIMWVLAHPLPPPHPQHLKSRLGDDFITVFLGQAKREDKLQQRAKPGGIRAWGLSRAE